MEILNQLRAATGAVHTRIEALPVCEQILAGTIDRESYAALLGNLFHLHDRYESALNASSIASIWPVTPSRAAAIDRDLPIFNHEPGSLPDIVEEWQSEIEALDHPAAWAGVGYVLEGSRMGSRVLVRSLAKAFEIEPRLGVGLDYHLDAGSDPNGTWRAVMAALVALDDDGTARDAIIRAAMSTFEAMYALHEVAAYQTA
jgi:heme oxygenase (biliverdin-IX-beta and delta-forming)